MKVFYIKKGKSFLANDLKFYKDTERAWGFESKKKACKILMHNVPCEDREKCKIIEKSLTQIATGFVVMKAKPCVATADRIYQLIQEKKDITDKLTNTETALETMQKELENTSKELAGKISIIDKEIVDIMHYVEFCELPTDKGYEVYKLLHNKTNERRKAKDKKIETDLLLDILKGTKTFEAYTKHLLYKQSPIYTPRALPELFQQVG